MKTDDVLMSVEQAAEVGKVPVNTIRCWVRQGKLAVVREGRRVMITRGALEGLVMATCELCAARFRRATLRARFCSTRCRQKAHRLSRG